MQFTYTPEKLRQAQDPEFEHLVRRARECLLWRMTPEYWDNMSQKEYRAWIIAWNRLQKEAQKG